VVFVFFPKRDDERALLERYQREDEAAAAEAEAESESGAGG
jgi:hypothetical protein